MVDVDSETLFDASAAIVSTVAVVYFVVNVEFPYSPASKALLVVAFVAGVFAVTQRSREYRAILLGYGVVVVSAVALYFDVVNTFRVADVLTVVGLLILAGLLFSLPRRLDEEGHFVTGRRATYVFAALVVLAACVLVVDVATGGLTYHLTTRERVTVPSSTRNEIVVGTVAARNPTPLPERVDAPHYGVCPAGNWSAYRPSTGPGEPSRPVGTDVNVRDGYREYVFGYGTKTYPVELYLHADGVEGKTFPVRTTSGCPDETTGPPYVALFERQASAPIGRPV